MTRRPLCLVCLILMLCMCIADLAGLPLISGNPLPENVKTCIKEHPDAVICGEIQRCQDTEFSFSVYLKHVFLIYRSEKIPIKNVRVFLKNKEDIFPGNWVSVSGRLEPVEGPRNPGEFNLKQMYACEHIYYFMKNGVVEKKTTAGSLYKKKLLELKEKLSSILKEAAGKDAPVYEAMLLGEKGELDPELKMRYQMAGILHILAISGLHISILGMGLFSLFKWFGAGNGTAGCLALVFMLQYGIMTGGSISSMRAIIMFVISIGARILGRIYDVLTALALAAILLLLDSPACLYNSSFLLSFGAVTGIACAAPALNRIFGVRKKSIKVLTATAGIQIMTLPVALMTFGEISLVGVFLNLAVLPTVGGVLLSGVCSCMFGFLNRQAAILAAVPGRVLLWIYEKMCVTAGKLPFCTWIGGKPSLWQCISYYLLLVTGFLLVFYLKSKMSGNHKGSKKELLVSGSLSSLLVLFGILILAWKPAGNLRITCLDIGQGDGIVLELPHQGTFIVDCGSSNKKNIASCQLLPYLKSQGISFIDGIWISHTDQDHISGILELLEYMAEGMTAIKAGTLLLPMWSSPPEIYGKLQNLAEKAGMQVVSVKEGDMFSYGEARIRILAPLEGAAGENVNEEGTVMELEYKKFRGLFTGDIGADTEKKLIDRFRDVDFLKTAHHGSRYSSCQEFLDQTTPEAAVISCSDSNTYGHPSPETTLRMKKKGVRIEFTMKHGAITLCTDGEQMTIERFAEE